MRCDSSKEEKLTAHTQTFSVGIIIIKKEKCFREVLLLHSFYFSISAVLFNVKVFFFLIYVVQGFICKLICMYLYVSLIQDTVIRVL